ncbi:UNVERIFIED_CONTAM: Retrovirus-related Pol polyprotein from transposon, partial [Sesamum indicum]
MCVDFTDLNKACPKDPYPLPRIDVMVDSTAGYEMFSMMDAYQGYHQIHMAEEDKDKTSFITEKGIFCYNMMPFGLKNAGATYQRLVNKMFGDLLGKTMEVYVDDMLVKSKRSQDHLADLAQAFAIMKAYGMKLNPDKCTFGDSEKTQELRMERRVREGPARAQEVPDDPSLISEPKEHEELFVYLGVSEHAVSSVLVREEGGRQNPIYYVSKMLQGAELRYTEMEKLALALVVTARKLRPYFQSHKVIVLTNYPLKHIMSRPEASGRLIKWTVELGQHDIEYRPRTAQKAQVLADFVTELAGEPDPPRMVEEQTSKWMLHVDGASNANSGGAGVWIQGPKGVEIETAVRLAFP